MLCLPSNSVARQGGAALIVAMLVFALCTALVVAMKSEFMLFYQRGANLFWAEQSYAYLRGAEDLGKLALQADFDAQADPPRDDLTEFWAQAAQPYALDEGGWMQGSLADLQGRFNLNSLQPLQPATDSETPKYTPSQQQFIRLLQSLEGVEVSLQDALLITESVGDWLDSDSRAGANGAEDDFYYGLTPAYRAANQAMKSVTELRAIAYVTAEIYTALAPLVTVWPESPALLNIHTASPTVLRSLNVDGDLNPLSPEQALQLAQYRASNGFVDADDFLVQAGLSAETTVGVRALLGESSSYFLLTAQVDLADRRMHLYSVLFRQNRELSVLARSAGEL